MNEVLVISAVSWTLAQLIKVVLGRRREKHFDWRYLIASGRMPSAHSATTSAMATATAWTQGLNSAAFAITAIVALIVMYDAAGVRQAVSRQSVILNRIIRELHENRPRDEVERNLREFIGHTPIQVFVGATLGILVTFVWMTLSSL